MDQLGQDLRIALRGLARTKGFTATVLLTLALGIGANVAIFSVVNGILLRPMPFSDPDRIVAFNHRAPVGNVSEPEFVDYRRDITSLSQLAAYAEGDGNLTGGEVPERIITARVSDRFFSVLGEAPLMGRTFTDAEDAPATTPPPVVMISYRLWQRYYGADPAIIGRTVQLNGVDRSVIGVMPPRFDFPSPSVAVWTPLRLNYDTLWARNNHYLQLVGRVAPGATIERAAAEARTLATRWTTDFPDTYGPGQALVPVVVPIADFVVGTTKPYLIALLGGAGFVLLIACVNVANLLLIRGEGRRNELGVRTALGASPGRLTRQLLTESAILAAAGALLGLVVAWGGTRLLLAAAPDSIPRQDQVSIDGAVLAFTLLVATATGLLFGWWPARRASRSDSMDALRQSRRLGGSIGRRARLGLVTAEIALAVMILAGAGLLIRSLQSLQSIDPGFDPSGMLTARISLPELAYNDQRSIGFVGAFEERLAATPGIRSVATMGWTPVVGGGGTWSIWIDGRTTSTVADAPAADPQQVTAGYFETMRIPIKAGRSFTAADREDAPLVVIVNEATARMLWPGQNPVGHTLKMFGGKEPWVTVIGMAGDIRSYGVDKAAPATMYFPYPQAARSAYFIPRVVTLAIRTAGEPTTAALALRRAVRELDPTVPLSELRTMDAVMGTSLANRRFSTTLLGAFAALAMLLAGIGIYGVVAYGVSQRTAEIGLRMALGADLAAVLKLVVVSEGLRVIGLGLLIGLAGAVAIGRAIQSLLVGVSGADPVTIAGVTVSLTVVGVLASIIPARRASNVSPTEALRSG